MKVAPNPAAFTALSKTDFKNIPRPEARENKLIVPDAKLKAKADQAQANKKADTFRADQDKSLERQRQQNAADRRSREAPKPRSSGNQRLGQRVDIRV